jgi:hypothetical protein
MCDSGYDGDRIDMSLTSSHQGAIVTNLTISTSPQFFARIAGVFYLFIVGGIFAEMFVRDRVFVRGDAAATANNILAHETLYRAGFVADFLILIAALVVLYLLYHLLLRVNRELVLLMAFFNLAGIAIQGANLLDHMAALTILKSGATMSALDPGQWQALAYLPLRFQSTGYDLALAVFGFFCLVAGYLIYPSRYLPRTLGVLMVIAGVCYHVNSFIHFPAPQHSLFPFVVLPCLIAELSLTIWLIAKGIDERKWATWEA